ncbi:MAG: glycosyltransferase family 4 protein [Patescibacteria group bacterium]
MRLLILTQAVDRDDPALGFFHTWIEEFSTHAEQVIVVCLREGEHSLPSNVRVLSLGKEKKPSRLRYLFLFYQYIWSYRREYDGVFVHMNPEYAILGGPLWWLLGKRIALWYVHKAVNFRLRLAEKCAHQIFTASRESFRLPSKKVEIVGHGIPVDAFPLCTPHALSLQRLRMLLVGRITPTKDVETAIMAAHALKQRFAGADISLDIVGDTVREEDLAYQETLKELVAQLQMNVHVHFLGKRTYREMGDIYRSHDLLIHTSRTGSTDKAALEALAAGMVLISSSDAFAGEAAKGLVWTFPPNDYQALAESVEAICARGILIPRQEGRAYVAEHHALSQLIPRIVSEFETP